MPKAVVTLVLACAPLFFACAPALFAIQCAPPPSDRDVVVIASGADLESGNPLVTVHPLARQVQRFALFVTLARYDSALRAMPYFARAWTWSADRRSVTLALEPSLVWHDGTPTTARDVAFTLDAARDPATGSPRAADLVWLQSTVVHNDTSITLLSHRPLAELPSILCELPIVPAERLSAVPRADFRRHAFATQPLGNGPFRFVERRAGERWVFERVASFPATMGGPARMRRLVVAVVDEPTTKFAGLVSGDLDLAGISPVMAPLVQRDPTLEVLSYPVSFASALVFNASRPPFDDVRVRRAVSAAIDRARIVKVALVGYATPATGAVSPEHPHADTAVAYQAALDPAVLLDSAGWHADADGRRVRNGTALHFTLLTVGSGDNALEQLLQADMRRVGISMDIRQMEFGAFLVQARANPKTFDALVTGIPGDLSLSHLAGMFDSQQRGGALDYAGFHEPTLDTLFRAAREATTPNEQRTAWIGVQQRLAELAPVAWLYHARGVQGVSRRLRGVRMDLRGELATLAEWRVAPPGGSR